MLSKLGQLLSLSTIVVLPGWLPAPGRAATFNIANGDVVGLIAAINTSNAAPGPDTINLANNGTYTLTVVHSSDNGLPTITSEIILNGNGSTLQRSSTSGTPAFRILQVVGPSSGDLTLNRLTVRGADSFGGGAGIHNQNGTLRLNNCTVRENIDHFFGGGIFNDGSSAVLIVTASSIRDNGARLRGGGIYNLAASATLTSSTVSSNIGDSGGGIFNHLSGSNLTLNNSTVSGNSSMATSGASGGGILNSDGILTLVNSTVTANSEANLLGGAVFNNGGSGIINMKNAIVASNTPKDCVGVIASGGRNIAGDATCGLSGVGDRNNTNPLLGPLAANGGLTMTHAILPGSPAIDAVPLAACLDSNGAALSTDQRGVTRPQGPACDIGSFEAQSSTLTQTAINWNPTPVASITLGNPITLRVEVQAPGSSNLSNGTYVVFYDGPTILGYDTPGNNGIATINAILSSAGRHHIRAYFSGRTSGATPLSPSLSPVVMVQVNPNTGATLAPDGPTGDAFPNNLLVLANMNNNRTDVVYGGGRPGFAVLNATSNMTFDQPPPVTSIVWQTGANWFTMTGNSSGLAVADFDQDGIKEVVVTSANQLAIVRKPGNVNSNFQNGVLGSVSNTWFGYSFASGEVVTSPVVADFDNDGDSDIAVLLQTAKEVRVFYANGAASKFTLSAALSATDSSPRQLIVGNFNQDLRPDLAWLNSLPNSISVLLATPSGFDPRYSLSLSAAATSLVADYFNGDVHLDLAVLTPANLQIAVWAGDPLGAFQNTPTVSTALGNAPPLAIAAGHFNNDAFADLIVSKNGRVEIMRGNNLGGFQTLLDLDIGTRQGAAVGTTDFSGDGREDVVLANLAGGVAFLRNSIPSTMIRVAGNNQNRQVTQPFPTSLTVDVLSPQGLLLQGIDVSFVATPHANGASLAPFVSPVKTNVSGRIALAVTANNKAESYVVRATVPGFPGAGTIQFALTNDPGPPAALNIVSGSGQSAAVNNSFSDLVASVTDAQGNFVPGVSVTFTPPPTGASAIVNPLTQVTAANGSNFGRVSVNASANTIAGGPYNVRANAGALPAVNFALTNTAGNPTAKSIAAGNPQSATIGLAFPSRFKVQVKDQYGNGVPGRQVTFTAPSTAGSFPGPLTSVVVTSGSDGFAEAPVFTAGTALGNYVVSANTPGTGATPLQFNITVVAPVPANISLQANYGDAQFSVTVNGTTTNYTGNSGLLTVNNNASVTFSHPPNPQTPSAGVRYFFSQWSGQSTDPVTLATPIGGAAYAAYFHAAYRLNVNGAATTNPSSGDGFYQQTASTFIPVTVTGSCPQGAPVQGLQIQHPAYWPVNGSLVAAGSPTVVPNGSVITMDRPWNVLVQCPATCINPPADELGHFSLESNAGPVSDNKNTLTARIVTPSSISGNHSVGGTTTLTPGRTGNGLTFLNSPRAAINIDGTPSLNAHNEDITVTAYVKLAPGEGGFVFGRFWSSAPQSGVRFGGGSSARDGFFVDRTSRQLGIEIADSNQGTAGNMSWVSTGANLAVPLDSDWHCIGFRIRRTNVGQASEAFEVTVFRDGYSEVITDYPGYPPYPLSVVPGTPSIYLGWQGLGGIYDTGFFGSMDEPRIFSRSLSDTEMIAICGTCLTQSASVTVNGGSPQSTVVNSPFAQPLSVIVRDQSNTPVAGVPVNFVVNPAGNGARATLSSLTAVTNASGVAAVNATANSVATTGAPYTVTASVAGGITSATFALTNTGSDPPATVTIVSGSPQSAAVGTAFPLPLIVVVRDTGGNPVQGATVNFFSGGLGANSILSASSVTTNASGSAQVTATANSQPGSYGVHATVTGTLQPAVFALTNTGSGPPATVTIVSGSPQSAAVGTAFPLPLIVVVRDTGGNPVQGATVNFFSGGLGANSILSASSVTTNSSGNAQVTATANSQPGSYGVHATVTGTLQPAVFALTNTGSGPPATVTIVSGSPQSAAVGTAFPLPLIVVVRDTGGNPVQGATVNFFSGGLGANSILSASSVTTNASGNAQVTATANSQPGSYGVHATVTGTLQPAVFALTNTGSGPPATVTIVSGSPQSAAVGTAFPLPLIVVVRDTGGNPVQGATVNFSAAGITANATLSAVSVTTNSLGNAQVNATANSQPGTYNVLANVTGTTQPAIFNLTNTAPVTATIFVDCTSPSIDVNPPSSGSGNGTCPPRVIPAGSNYSVLLRYRYAVSLVLGASSGVANFTHDVGPGISPLDAYDQTVPISVNAPLRDGTIGPFTQTAGDAVLTQIANGSTISVSCTVADANVAVCSGDWRWEITYTVP